MKCITMPGNVISAFIAIVFFKLGKSSKVDNDSDYDTQKRLP